MEMKNFDSLSNEQRINDRSTVRVEMREKSRVCLTVDCVEIRKIGVIFSLFCGKMKGKMIY